MSIALSPPAEQYNIVVKVDALMALLNRQEVRHHPPRLIETLLHEPS